MNSNLSGMFPCSILESYPIPTVHSQTHSPTLESLDTAIPALRKARLYKTWSLISITVVLIALVLGLGIGLGPAPLIRKK